MAFPGSSKLLWLSFFTLLSGCQIGYIVKSGYNQLDLLFSREELSEIHSQKKYADEIRAKLALASEVKSFAEQQLFLKKTDNYSSYVHLDREYVTWIVTAAEKHALKKYKWWFPIIGSVPYKGYFNKEDALAEEQTMKNQGYDTWVRGVRAYSTLGWFSDPLLSSMLKYKDHDLVDVVIHELVHSTLYINSNSDFNEQLAVYFALVGTKKFFELRKQPEIIEQIDREYSDQIQFAKFINTEIDSLKKWYESRNGSLNEAEREQRLGTIKIRFTANLKPKLKTDIYRWFETAKLNNARLMAMGTYMKGLSAFDRAFKKLDGSFEKYIEKMKEFEGSDDPTKDLSNWLDQ